MLHIQLFIYIINGLFRENSVKHDAPYKTSGLQPFPSYPNILSQDLWQVSYRRLPKSDITQVQNPHAYFNFTAFHFIPNKARVSSA